MVEVKASKVKLIEKEVIEDKAMGGKLSLDYSQGWCSPQSYHDEREDWGYDP